MSRSGVTLAAMAVLAVAAVRPAHGQDAQNRLWEAARSGLDVAASCGGYAGAYRLHQLLARALEDAGRKDEAAAERDRAAREIARLSRDLGAEHRASFQRIAEGWDLEDRNESGRSGRRDAR